MKSVLVAQVRLSAWLIKRNYSSFIAFRLEKRSSTEHRNPKALPRPSQDEAQN